MPRSSGSATTYAQAETKKENIPLEFPQGVASGDPQPDAVMLWTRAVPAAPASGTVPVTLQVSTSEGFEEILLESTVAANPENDYTLRGLIKDIVEAHGPDGSLVIDLAVDSVYAPARLAPLDAGFEISAPLVSPLPDPGPSR